MTQLIQNRYRLDQRIGAGGMAEVYAGFDRQLDRPVAIKILHTQLQTDAHAVEQFQHEARRAASFSHQHIAQVYDVGHDPQRGPFYVQELIGGHNLDELLPVAAPQALLWLEQIAAAVAAIHAQGLVHCDIKPQNIRITADNSAVLLDFGIAQPAGTASGGAIYGTPHYLAPERAQGAAISTSADVYALGILLYVMLTGAVPIDGATPAEILRGHMQQGVPALRAQLPGQAQAIEALIARATERDPAQRISSVHALIESIQAITTAAQQHTQVIATLPKHATISFHNQTTQQVKPAQPAAPARPDNKAAAIPPLPPPPAATVIEAQHAAAAAPPSIPAAAPQLPAASSQLRKRRWLPQLAVALMASIVLGLMLIKLLPSAASSAVVSPTPTTVNTALQTPALLGLNIADAQQLAASQGLQVTVVDEVASSAPAGQIIAQDPQPQAPIDQDIPISVHVSLGPGAAQPAPDGESSPGAAQPAPDGGKGRDKGSDKGKGNDKGNGKGKDK